MKCPKCGSEHIQFVSNTSSKGFSAGNACCGSVMFGPLGLLCGACGAGTKKEEYWICRGCGNKFANWEGQLNQGVDNLTQKIADNKYEDNKQIRDNAVQKYGSIENIRQLAAQSDERLDNLIKEFHDFRKINIAPDADNEMLQLKKESEGPSGFGIVMFLLLAGLGLIGLLGGGVENPFGWICLAIALVLFVVGMIRMNNADDRINEKLARKSDRYKEICESLGKERVANKELKEIIVAINECERYEEEMAQRN